MRTPALAPLLALSLLACRDPGHDGAASGPKPQPPLPSASSRPAPSASVAPPPSAAPEVPRCDKDRIFIPGGAFRMGAGADEKDASPQEKPAHDVTVTAFCIDRTEVTVAQYKRCSETGECQRASAIVVSPNLSAEDIAFWSGFCNAGHDDRGDHPVNCVDWKQAADYCRWAGGRLPTEAEWEFSARGTDGRRYPWGNDPPSAARMNGCGKECASKGAALGRHDAKTMYDGDDGAETTAPVGRYPEGKSPFGVLDMAGNVWEWTADVYAPYEAKPSDKPPRAGLRAVRGGHWLNTNPATPRAAHREGRDESKRLEDVGIRCVAAPRG